MSDWEYRISEMVRHGGAWIVELAEQIDTIEYERNQARECADDRLNELNGALAERDALRARLDEEMARGDKLDAALIVPVLDSAAQERGRCIRIIRDMAADFESRHETAAADLLRRVAVEIAAGTEVGDAGGKADE